MYPISDEVLELFKKNYRQIVNITLRGANKTITLTEADIRQGGFSIDRYSLSNSKIEMGSAVAAELNLTLENNDDRFSDIVFEDAELEVKIGIKKWDAYKWENAVVHWIPCGFFTVDDPPRKLASISLSALDRMVKFDAEITSGIFPTTVENLVKTCCSRCGVTLATDLTTLPNYNYTITYEPEDDSELTYRQLIQWAAEMMGVCAYIDWNGELRMEWYSDTDTKITKSERYSSDLYENDIVITGVQITDSDDNVYLAGTDDYAFNISGNNLITHDYDTVVANLYAKLGGFTYRPYSATIKPMPHIYPLDRIDFVDKNGASHNTIVSNVTFKMNQSTEIAGKGETTKKNSYSAANPLTKEESIVVQKIRKEAADGDKNIEQSFKAADGELLSKITEEVTRATTAEDGLSTTITEKYNSVLEQTSSSITAAVSEEKERAVAAESGLSASITEKYNAAIQVTSDNITSAVSAEKTRAMTAEDGLSTTITEKYNSVLEQTATMISAKVSATGGEDSSFSWSLTSDGFVLKANNETVMNVTSSGLTVKGIVQADSGYVGGFTLADEQLYAGDSSDNIAINPKKLTFQHFIKNTWREDKNFNVITVSQAHTGEIELSKAKLVLNDNWIMLCGGSEGSYYHYKYYPLFEINDTYLGMTFTIVWFYGEDSYGGELKSELRTISGSINDLRESGENSGGSGGTITV